MSSTTDSEITDIESINSCDYDDFYDDDELEDGDRNF